MLLKPLESHDGEDSVTQTTAVIQEAIDECAEAGGGTVLLGTPGVYVIDGLVMRSYVTLEIEENVVLKGSGRADHYTLRPGPFELVRTETPIRALIYGKSLVGATICGQGTINGNYEIFIPPHQDDMACLSAYTYPRPMTLYFEDCRHTTITGVSIKDVPFWSVHLVGCVNTSLSGLTIKNEMRMPNTDGIDVDRCVNTLIEGCTIITGDDGICLKCTEETAQYGDCVNLLVRNCMLESQSSAIKFGSSSFGMFENAVFEDVTIRDSNRGIAFQLRDPGGARTIVFKDISISTKRFSKDWWGSGEPIHITLLPRFDDTDLSGSRIEDVRFDNVRCEADNAIFIHAETNGKISGISFTGCTTTLRQTAGLLTSFDLRPTSGATSMESQTASLVTDVDGVTWDGKALPRTSLVVPSPEK